MRTASALQTDLNSDDVINILFISAGKRMASQKPKACSHQPLNRREVLRAGLESLAQQRELRELQERPQTNTTGRRRAAPPPERSKADIMKVL